MSQSEFVQERSIRTIQEHPNADSLAIIKVGSFQIVHSLEEAKKLRVGQLVLHFPTDICIDPDKAVELGVDTYCRSVDYKGQGKAKCRIVAARLRGAPSYGFIKVDYEKTLDYDEHYGVWKYEPPEPSTNGSRERYSHPEFPKYTKMKRIQLDPGAWTVNLPVRVTEKLHGQNCRLGVVRENGEWRFMVGSHNVILKNQEGNPFWQLLDEKVMTLLNELCNGENPVVIFGERLGKGVQDMDYGFETPTLRVFDIMVNGEYLDWDLVQAHCEHAGVLTVPLLYEGGFSWCMVDNMTDGQSVLQHPDRYLSKFKGREGIVITPLKETVDARGNRLIAKSISADYESRKGGTEYH